MRGTPRAPDSRLIYVEAPSHEWLKLQTYPGTIQIAVGSHDRSVREGWVWIRRPAGGVEVFGGGRDSIIPPSVVSVETGEVYLNDVWGGSSFLHPATIVRVRLWIVLAASVVPLIVAVYGARRRRLRRRLGFCERCGYDLTANASGRCPECGAATAEPSPA
jgi:hypothetical protein